MDLAFVYLITTPFLRQMLHLSCRIVQDTIDHLLACAKCTCFIFIRIHNSHLPLPSPITTHRTITRLRRLLKTLIKPWVQLPSSQQLTFKITLQVKSSPA